MLVVARVAGQVLVARPLLSQRCCSWRVGSGVGGRLMTSCTDAIRLVLHVHCGSDVTGSRKISGGRP